MVVQCAEPLATGRAAGAVSIEGGLDCISGSLEDLVSNFDEKLTVCFGDFTEQVDKIAPVQVRSQEEIMNECQVGDWNKYRFARSLTLA